jgi:predicted RNA-binding Zn-ribbon protein involved in translation (DUF1610 family)
VTFLKLSDDVGILLRILLFVFGCLILLFGLQYFIYPISMSRTVQRAEVGYDYETGITLAVPGLVMILIGVVWTVASIHVINNAPTAKMRCPHCGMEVYVSTIPNVYSVGGERVTSLCPRCGKRI